MHLFNASTWAVVGSYIANSIRSVDEYANRVTLERYDVESCGERLIVSKLPLGRSPGVFTPLLFNVLDQLRSQYALAPLPNGGTIQRSTIRNRTSLHMSEVVISHPMLQ